MTLLLRAMQRVAGPSHDQVLIPSYTCYSVAASVVKAGLRPRLVDINPDTLDFDYDELATIDFTRILAIVATNLYGIPNDMPRLAALARRRGVFLIDDAAQAMGAQVGGRPCGTWGDAGIFSFDKGKNVSAIDGGIVITDSGEIAAAIDAEMATQPTPSAVSSTVHVAKAIAYFMLLRPSLYGVPARIPQLGLGKTEFTTEFPLHHADPRLVALGVVMLRHLDEFTAARVSRASALLHGLQGAREITTIAPPPGASPAYLRFPILFVDAESRRSAIEALTAAGIGATASYPEALADVPELRPHLANPSDRVAGGRSVARRIATLPTHPFVTTVDVARMITLLRKGTTTACAA